MGGVSHGFAFKVFARQRSLCSFMQKQYNFHDYEDEGRYESTFFRGKEPCQYEEYTDCQPEASMIWHMKMMIAQARPRTK